MGDNGKGGVKNLKKMGDVIYGWPLIQFLQFQNFEQLPDDNFLFLFLTAWIRQLWDQGRYTFWTSREFKAPGRHD